MERKVSGVYVQLKPDSQISFFLNKGKRFAYPLIKKKVFG
jgi:hypothetical protein